MISVILCTYNRAQTLKTTLASLQQMRVSVPGAWELVIVDNNSSDDTEKVVKDYRRSSGFDVQYVFEREQGHSHARNRGIREAAGPILAFIDDDVTVGPGWLERIATTYDRFDCLGMGGRIVAVWPCAKPAWLADTSPYPLMKAIVSFDLGDQPCALTTPPFGANMSFKKVAFERYGLFRTDLGRHGRGLTGGEDTEFGRRLLRHGETLIYDPAAVVYHPVEPERLTRRYWLRWYFAYGRMAARRADAASRLGLLPPLLRGLLANLLEWLVALDGNRRFYYKLNVYRALGQLREVCTIRGRRGTISRLP